MDTGGSARDAHAQPTGLFGVPRQPYQPPDTPQKSQVGAPRNEKSRPWLALRDGETLREWYGRMSHTCWRCGNYNEDSDALDEHEAEHGTAAE